MTAEIKTKRTALQYVAQVLSDLFSPIMLPAYMMTLSMWLTPLVLIPEKIRIIAMVVIAVLTAVLPTATIITLLKLGKVKDMSLSDRKERPIPYLVSIVCYLAAVWYLMSVRAPHWLVAFYIAAAATSIIAGIITLRWKISAHSSAVGGFSAAIVWLSLHKLILIAPVFWAFGAIMLCGLIGSSRLILNRHTPAQVFAGFALGAGSVLIALSV